MARRELLVFHPLPGAADIEAAVEAAGWRARVEHSVRAAMESARCNRDAIALAVLNDEHPALDELESLLEQSTVDWICAIPQHWRSDPRRMRLVTASFLDFHTLPLDPRRLAITLGHCYGMAMARLEFRPEDRPVGHYGMVGDSPPMRDLYAKLARVTQADAPVLVLGESGTGKELVARAIHQHSDRARGPFVPVNCGGLPGTLVQSELFGHEKGAFTGAYQRKAGSIEAASGGVIFLDEIGDLPLDLQANLLRFLQEKTIVRLGSSQRIPIDVRVIAATHVNLQEAVGNNQFREDLYYRLNVLHLHVPPLRERPDDIQPLALECVRTFNRQRHSAACGFRADAIRVMRQYHWPGNVRELFNRVQRALVMCEHRLIGPADLGLQHVLNHRPSLTLHKARAAIEENVIRLTLQKHANNVSMAARELDVSRVTLYRLIEKFKLRSN
jgi:DNA-binding NtrC family response regulator